jgi:hypothetical protein
MICLRGDTPGATAPPTQLGAAEGIERSLHAQIVLSCIDQDLDMDVSGKDLQNSPSKNHAGSRNQFVICLLHFQELQHLRQARHLHRWHQDLPKHLGEL